MADEEALEALRRLTQVRTDVVHELATCWNVVTNGLHGLQGHVVEPELIVIFEDMCKAEARGRALFEALRRLL